LGLPGTHPVAYDEQARPPPHPIMPFFLVCRPLRSKVQDLGLVLIRWHTSAPITQPSIHLHSFSRGVYDLLITRSLLSVFSPLLTSQEKESNSSSRSHSSEGADSRAS